ncbi:hypothetical protein A9174_24980 [Mesorhizobium loti NZP2037]|nr:hypothetical protein [Mesorhizobium loti]ANN59649.1 hypothetical protein A9174_24980 [Mesorhizobium loti NZP2037]
MSTFTNAPSGVEQIDVTLCEDMRTVMLHAYDRHDKCWIQSFDPLPMPIEEKNLIEQEWRAAAQLDAWRPLP